MVTLSTHSWNFGETVAGISCLMQSRTVTPLAPSTVDCPISIIPVRHKAPMAQAYFLDITAPTPSIAPTPGLRGEAGLPVSRRLVGIFDGRNVRVTSKSSIAPGRMLDVNHHNRRQPVTEVHGTAMLSSIGRLRKSVGKSRTYNVASGTNEQ